VATGKLGGLDRIAEPLPSQAQYENLKEKGMSKERAARIANSPGASSRGGKKSGSSSTSRSISSQGGTTAQKKVAGRKGGRAQALSPRPGPPHGPGAVRVPARPPVNVSAGGLAIGRGVSATSDEDIDRRHCATAAFVAVLAAGLGIAALPSSSNDKQLEIRAVRAVADSYVTESNRVANFGQARSLRVDAAPLTRAYLRFRPKYPNRHDVKQVNLLVFSRTGLRSGFRVRVVSPRWRERDITFENAPRLPARYVASGRIRARVWKAVDVTPIVDTEDEEVSFALTTIALDGLELASRETGLTSPRLVVELNDEDRGGPGSALRAVPPER
jgi:hypothetical protein